MIYSLQSDSSIFFVLLCIHGVSDLFDFCSREKRRGVTAPTHVMWSRLNWVYLTSYKFTKQSLNCIHRIDTGASQGQLLARDSSRTKHAT